VYLVRTDANGETLFTRTFGGTNYDYAGAVQQTVDGGYIVTGYTYSYGAGSMDVYLIRTDAYGETLWTRTFGGTETDQGFAVQQTTDGGYIVAGYTYSLGAGGPDAYAIKTDANGDSLWTGTYGSRLTEAGRSVQQTTDGGYIITGYTNYPGARGYDVYLVKTDSLGGAPVAVAEPEANPTRASSLSLCCEPNPCRVATTIRLSPFAFRHSPLTLRMYDSQGRMVLSRLVSTSSFPLSTSDLPSGAYFLRLDADGQHATARLVLQR
jgi:hypothetical protein